MLVALIAVSGLVAQTGEAAFKQARKSFDTYKLNSDKEALAEAVTLIATAMEDAEVAADPKALVEAGDIYKEAVIQYVNKRFIDANDKERMFEMPGVMSAKAYMKAYEMAEKKGDKKAALKGLSEIQGNLTNEGIYAIQDGATNPKLYEQSYTSFTTNLMVNDFLEKNGGEVLVTPESITQDKYFAALAATLSKQYENALPLYEELYAAKYDDAAIYDGLYKIYTDKGMKDKAEKVLVEGRERYPEESSLLFTEINYLLGEGRLDELTGKLETAINKEPENMSLYSTLASVYERLYNQANEAGKTDEAADYFAKAEAEYNRGLAKDPNSSRMIYGLGAMIYNKGALMSQDLETLGDDFSKEGQKKYDALKAKVDAEFAKALPFFQKAEMADPNDVNTLIALKEMYARQGEYEVSGEFKERIATIQGGGKVGGSYFKEKGM
ncbi:hypothetical protein A3850_013415 [Lewinella sp. 4G2]|nr:hypothetical protein A3850_013415 [Lewinella sp. 4G2]